MYEVLFTPYRDSVVRFVFTLERAAEVQKSAEIYVRAFHFVDCQRQIIVNGL